MAKDSDCAICLEDMHNPVARACGHKFCNTCIKKWYAAEGSGVDEGSCPMCRDNWKPRCQKDNTETDIESLIQFLSTFDRRPDVVIAAQQAQIRRADEWHAHHASTRSRSWWRRLFSRN